jgi:phosphomethylpyrimidine synthase
VNLLQRTKQGIISDNIKIAAGTENHSVELLIDKILKGTAVIPANKNRQTRPTAIGEGLSTKVNANIGTSHDVSDTSLEIAKLEAAVKAGADAVMDLSSGPSVMNTMETLIKNCPVPFGTVPLYEITVKTQEKYGSFVEAKVDDFFDAIINQAELGVDFMTIHSGVNLKTLESLVKSDRLMDIVSRGGALTVAWMLHNEAENPFYEHFDRLLEIMADYDITMSLGDGMRPGSIIDASDKAQFHELSVLGDLVLVCRNADVQVIVEGPGHVPLNEIKMNIALEKNMCHRAPFYVLGPLVTDIAPGYDHITAAIGGAIAASAGADFLCYVTPSEHLSLPDLEDVKEGVIASKIAAHAADIAKNIPGAKDRDYKMSQARKALDWDKQVDLAIDPVKAKHYLSKKPKEEKACTMCGPYCAMKLISDYLGKEVKCGV